MRVYGLLSSLFFGISVYYYQGYNGAFVSAVGVAVKAMTLMNEKDAQILRTLSLPLSLLFYFFFNQEGIYGLFPAMALIFMIFADTQKDVLRMKYIHYGTALCWFVYAISISSIPAILFEVVGVITLSYGVFRIKKDRS